MEKVYSYTVVVDDNSFKNFDRIYYLMGRYFPKESLKIGWKRIHPGNDKLFIHKDSLSDEDRTFFELKTGIHFVEDSDRPKILIGLDLDGSLPEKQWLAYDEVKKYLHIKPEESLF